MNFKILRIGQSGYLIKNTDTGQSYNIIALSRDKNGFIFRINGLTNIKAKDKFKALEIYSLQKEDLVY